MNQHSEMTKVAADALAAVARANILLDGRAAGLPLVQNDEGQSEDRHTPTPELPEFATNGPRAVLARLFGLSAAEIALLDFCIAVALEPALEDRIADLQGRPWRPVPTEALVRRLYNLPMGSIWRPTSPLARWHLVDSLPEASGAAPAFRADPRVADWYMGKAVLDAGLVGRCRIPAADAAPIDWDVSRPIAALRALASPGRPVRFVIVGHPGSGRAEFCGAVARAAGHDVLEVDGTGLTVPDIEVLYPRLQRFALLTGRVPVWCSLPERWPGHLPAVPLQCVAVVDRSEVPRDTAQVFEMRQPRVTLLQRETVWSTLTEASMPRALMNAPLLQLRAAAELSNAAPGMVESAIRDRALCDLAVLGRVIEPQVDWDDLILPASVRAALSDYVNEARGYAELLAAPNVRRLFAKDAAPTALFTGPPGTGKTMAAQCTAAELGLPLLVIDVARTVSKFIGETAKNLSRVFAEAKSFGCVLFFDEADAYFSKRTDLKDSQDRHANADTGHLLQLIEDYEGIVILGTNKRAHIDEAFFRRIRHCVEFHKPARAEREEIWVRLAGHLFTSAEVVAARTALALCAERFELSPAQIKSAILSARYRRRSGTAPLNDGHLMAGVARELRKAGRSLPPDLVHAINPPEMQEAPHVA